MIKFDECTREEIETLCETLKADMQTFLSEDPTNFETLQLAKEYLSTMEEDYDLADFDL